MENKQGSWRSAVAVGLISVTLALPLSHAAAQQRYGRPAPYTQQEREEPSNTAQWLGAAFVIGLLYCAWTDCVGGGNSGERTPRQGEEAYSQKPVPARPDTSRGCVWGDRLFGTCR